MTFTLTRAKAYEDIAGVCQLGMHEQHKLPLPNLAMPQLAHGRHQPRAVPNKQLPASYTPAGFQSFLLHYATASLAVVASASGAIEQNLRSDVCVQGTRTSGAPPSQRPTATRTAAAGTPPGASRC